MENLDCIKQTVELLTNQYDYDEELIEINQEVPASSGNIKVDVLVRDKKGKPYLIVMVATEARDLSELRMVLEEILRNIDISYGVFRYQDEDGLAGFLGLTKKKSFLRKKLQFHEIDDYPKSSLSLSEVIFRFFENV